MDIQEASTVEMEDGSQHWPMLVARKRVLLGWHTAAWSAGVIYHCILPPGSILEPLLINASKPHHPALNNVQVVIFFSYFYTLYSSCPRTDGISCLG